METFIQRNPEETLEGGDPICFTVCDSYLVLQGPWELGKLVTQRYKDNFFFFNL